NLLTHFWTNSFLLLGSASLLGRCRSRCWGFVVGQHANFPGIAVTLVHGAPVSAPRVVAPLPHCPRHVARAVQVKALNDHVGRGAAFEYALVSLLNRLSARKYSCRGHKLSILREKCCDSRRIVLVFCICIFRRKSVKLLAVLLTERRFFLLGK